jgi:AraC-like DNA-binding protein
MSQIILSALLVIRFRRKLTLQEGLFLTFLVTVAAYLLYPILKDHWLAPFQTVVQNFLPGVFWLLCSSLFNDRFKIRFWHLCLVGITVAFPFLGQALAWQNLAASAILFEHIPQLLEFVLLSLALLEVVRHWNNDLIESRRDLRLWFCAMAGLYIFGLIALRELILPNSNWLALWQYLPVGVICLFTNLLLLQYRPGLLGPAEYLGLAEQANSIEENIDRRSRASEKTTADEKEFEAPADVVDQLDELMTKQFAYREMSLTIGQLARQVGVPEYRLRRIINAGLGFRNFNDYLNGFRIKEAGERLADPLNSDEAILNIALDVGFRSLSSFNKAFRDSFGVTPTQYRQRQRETEPPASPSTQGVQ